MSRALWCAVACVLIQAACDRESRPFKDLAKVAGRAPVESQTPLYAGAPAPPGTPSPFHESGWGINEGKLLYTQYNCAGCHAHGGGGIGPALMDDEGRYGFDPAGIYSTIVEGRPNGMPSFRNKIPDYQVWQLVAYVQSMSGQTPLTASSGRDDHMQSRRAENNSPYQGRTQTGHK
jgi:cytochrome c oxidase cbb3-type subunit III